MNAVCLVIGAGAGIGGTVGKRFAREGYHAVLCRRTDEAGLNKLVADIEAEGGVASGFLMNAAEENSIEARVSQVEAELGPIEIVVFNLGAQIGDQPLADTSYKTFEMGWRLATFALFRVAHSVMPHMEARGMANDGLLLPDAIAETYVHLHNQHRSAWTHEMDLRAFSDRPWWN